MDQTRIAIAVGTFSRTFLLFTTSAPASYDGCGTFCIYQRPQSADMAEQTRYLLIPEDAVTWQVARNLSGNHYTRPTDEMDRKTLQDRLLEQIFGL